MTVFGTLVLRVARARGKSFLPPGLERLVRTFHQAPLRDEWAALFVDGISLRVRRPSGRQRVQMLLAYGVKRECPWL